MKLRATKQNAESSYCNMAIEYWNVSGWLVCSRERECRTSSYRLAFLLK